MRFSVGQGRGAFVYSSRWRRGRSWSSFRRVGLAAWLCLLGPGAVDQLDGQQTAAESAEQAPLRGITVSTHRGGREWGDAKVMAATYDELVSVGANWVAIHPYASIRANGEVVTRPGDDFSWLAEPVRQAHAKGLQIMIKPHLAYWGSPFSWRGEIAFDTDEEWHRFFETYSRWILSVAKATVGADAFAVGTELDKTLNHEQQWRSVVRQIKAVNGAALTYASNWTDYWHVGFWDLLDAIGIQAYFPLSEDERPSEKTLRAAWSQRMEKLGKFSDDWKKPILFTELGYSRTWSAASRPWEAGVDDSAAVELQRLCLRVALEAIEGESRVVGSFLWKWFPEPRAVGRDFQMASPEVRQELSEVWQTTVGSPARSLADR